MKDDCTVSQAFIKILIVKKEASKDIVKFGPFTAATPKGCDAAVHTLSVEDVNVKIYNALGMSKSEFVAVYGPTSEDDAATPSNVTLEHMGKFSWKYDETSGRSTYLPTWTVGQCEIVWCEGETERVIKSVVTIAAKEAGYADLQITYNVVMKRPEINLTKSDFNSSYWNEDFTKVQHHSQKPVTGSSNPAGFIYENNINAAFKTHANQLLKLGDTFVEYGYTFAPAAQQIQKDVRGEALTITVGGNGKWLYAALTKPVTVAGVTIPAGTNYLIARINDHTATDITNPLGADVLEYENNALANYLLNSSSNFMWAKLNINAVCPCTDEDSDDVVMPVKVNGNDGFVVEFLRPINPNAVSTEKYIDGIDFGKRGSFLDIYVLAGLSDWRTDKFKDNANYTGFYGVTSINLAGGDVKWDANGTIETIPSTVNVKWHSKADVQTIDAGNADNAKLITTATPYNFGGVSYNHNGSVTQSFKLYIPITITYKWGVIISETVEVTVEGTTVTP